MRKNNFALILFAIASTAQAAVDEEQSARGACMLFAKQVLHDPGSAQFESAAYAKKSKKGVWTVQRHLRARNGYNALRSMVIECKMQLIEDQWKLIDIKQVQ